MLLRIRHETRLSYSAPVAETVFEARMAPPSDEDQMALSYSLRIEPRAPVTSYRDGFGNRVDLFNISTPYRELAIGGTSCIRVHRRPGRDRLREAEPPVLGTIDAEAAEFLLPSPLVDRSPALDALLARVPKRARSIADRVDRIMEATAGALTYEKEVTTARTLVGDALVPGRVYPRDDLRVTRLRRFLDRDPDPLAIQSRCEQALRRAVQELPPIRFDERPPA